MSKAARRLNVFLCHGSEDKEQVRGLYQRLKAADCHPWLDEVDILPGKKWESEIRTAVRKCDIILVCLSAKSADREGFVQKEIKFALDRADEMPPDRIFLIPVRLENCQMPDRLKGWQWVDLFTDDGFDKLARALTARAEEVDANFSAVRATPTTPTANEPATDAPESISWADFEIKPPWWHEPPHEETGDEKPMELERILPGRWIVRLEGRSESNTSYTGVGKGMFGLGYDAFVQLDEYGEFHANAEDHRAKQPWMAEGTWKLEDAHTLRINWCKYFGPEKWYRQTFHLNADSARRLSGTIDDVPVKWIRDA